MIKLPFHDVKELHSKWACKGDGTQSQHQFLQQYGWTRDEFFEYTTHEGIIVEIEDRPTDMLVRQLTALRRAVKQRNGETRVRHCCHAPSFVKVYVKDILRFRNELRTRGVPLKERWM